jgi:bacterioferritin
VGLLRLNGVMEAELIQHYAEAVRFCLLIGDRDHESFFRALWEEEQHHGEDLAAWIASLTAQANLQRAVF